MSEPITLTERERAVAMSLITFIDQRLGMAGTICAQDLLDWLVCQPTESASPPRVPVSSAHSSQVGVQSGPGQPTDIAEQLDRYAECAEQCNRLSHSTFIREAAAEIRRLRAALADKPAPELKEIKPCE